MGKVRKIIVNKMAGRSRYFIRRSVEEFFRNVKNKLLLGVLGLLFLGCASDISNAVTLDKPVPRNLLKKEGDILREIHDKHHYWESRHLFVEDRPLELYLEKVSGPFRLAADPAGGKDIFKFKIFRDPTLNFFSTLNGGIYAHTGFFSTCENEAQLAFVLAHEIAHVYYRDSLYTKQRADRNAVTFAGFDVLLAPLSHSVGMNEIADMGVQMMYIASVVGYSREEEQRADFFALEQMTRAGYDPSEVVKLFNAWLQTEWPSENGKEVYFLSDHPSTLQRREAALLWINQNDALIHANKFRPLDAEYSQKTYNVRLQNVQLNLDSHRPFHSMEEIEKILKENPGNPEANFLRGNIYGFLLSLEGNYAVLTPQALKKLQAADTEELIKEWEKTAKSSYQKALELKPEYASPYKGLGIFFMRKKNYDEAKWYFDKYLELEPQARDRKSVLRYLKDIEIAGGS
ncbi:MAG: M48 family metalloprotease [Candidatus Omnitrophica bacterium]|nr:M48 family metalloprotease [Candidatus Omnitrophota bacterium]